MSSPQRRLLILLERSDADDPWSPWVNGVIAFVIILNVIALSLASVPRLEDHYGLVFRWVEAVAILFLAVELGIRIWAAGALPSRWRYIFSPLTLLDIAILMPFIVHWMGGGLEDIFFLRLLRFLRLMRLSRYFMGMALLGRVLRAEARNLSLAFVVILIVCLTAAFLLHLVEGHVQPEKFGTVPNSLWWAIVTLTTVGYGDVTPMTAAGRAVASAIMICGIGATAFPTAILVSRFADELSQARKRRRRRQARRAGLDVHSEGVAAIAHELGLSHRDLARLKAAIQAEEHGPDS